MANEVNVPDWLERLVDQVLDSEDWPDDEYPRLAFEVRDRIGEGYDEDGQVSLLQLVIHEIERLRGVIFRNCPDPRDGVGPGDTDIIREIHQEFEPYCDCGDCNQQREEAAEAASEGGDAK